MYNMVLTSSTGLNPNGRRPGCSQARLLELLHDVVAEDRQSTDGNHKLTEADFTIAVHIHLIHKQFKVCWLSACFYKVGEFLFQQGLQLLFGQLIGVSSFGRVGMEQ